MSVNADDQSRQRLNRLRRANSDKILFAMLGYLLLPLAVIFVPLSIWAWRTESRILKELAPEIGVVKLSPPWVVCAPLVAFFIRPHELRLLNEAAIALRGERPQHAPEGGPHER